MKVKKIKKVKVEASSTKEEIVVNDVDHDNLIDGMF